MELSRFVICWISLASSDIIICFVCSCLESLRDVCAHYLERKWLYRFTFSILWKSRIEDVRRKVQECIRKFEVCNQCNTDLTTVFDRLFLKLKNTISIRKFHDVWREANHATTSHLKRYIDAVVSNTTQASVENRPQSSFVDNAYKGARVTDRAIAINRGILGFEQQATPNLVLPTTGISNSYQGATISDDAATFNGCIISEAVLQSLWSGRRR